MNYRLLLPFLGILLSAQAATFPKVLDVYTVDPQTLAIRFTNGERVPGAIVDYERLPTDVIKTDSKKPYARTLYREGVDMGYIVGPELSILREHDTFNGAKLDAKGFFFPELYELSSETDANYKGGLRPSDTNIKSKAIDFVAHPGWKFSFINETTLYLSLPQALKVGHEYTIQSEGSLFETYAFTFDPKTVRSEAVHLSHIGFRPNDPIKFATLSAWLGSGGALEYRDGLKFQLIDRSSGESVYQGDVVAFKSTEELDDPEPRRLVNLNLAPTYRMDFSDFSTPGEYHVAVEGVGTSYPFRIDEAVWEDLFKIAAKGMFFQRASIEVTEEFGGDFQRPLNFHPDMGKLAIKSAWIVNPVTFDPEGSVNQSKSFDILDQNSTGAVVDNAWGGHFDAGDFDRRTVHLKIPLLYMELYRSAPDYFKALEWNIPESGNAYPDLLDEAQWGIDIWKRLQTPEGGIPSWIESSAHPRKGESSWTDSLTLYLTLPEAQSSYVYAAAATRFASLIKEFDAAVAEDYLASAIRAFEFGESQFIPQSDSPNLRNEVLAYRNLAALELFAETGEADYHDIFLEHTFFTDSKADLFVWKNQREGGPNYQDMAAHAYVTLDLPSFDKNIRANAKTAILRNADWATEFALNTSNGFSKASDSANIGWGTMGAPTAINILRAYAITRAPKYLEGAIAGTQFMLGNNADNMTFTTGVGHKSPQNPLLGDVRKGNLPVPPGITVYGPWDNKRFNDWWSIDILRSNMAYIPEYELWPTSESFMDVDVMLTGHAEFTIQQTMVFASYYWGALAALGNVE